jgi:predicted enzyme related to lactoylglutathione lyase
MNSVVFFEIQADEPARAIAFYQSVFEWAFTKQEFAPVDYWQIETEGIRGGLLQRPVQTPSPQQGTNAFVCSVEVESFDAMADRAISNGGRIAMEKFAVPGKCWQGYFLDTEGNTFGLFQVDSNAA